MTDKELLQESLDAMLAAIESGDWKVDGACDPDWVIEAIKVRLAQPEPDDGYCTACEEDYCTAKDGCVALHNPPPKKEWVSVTKEEIMDACSAVWASHPIEVGNVVQDLLKEKNNV